MSSEIKIETLCDHKIVEDLAFLSEDRRTIPIARRVAVSKSLKIKRNGFLIQPDSPEFGYFVEELAPGVKQVVFKKPIKSQNDFFELTYITVVEDCPKCEGTSFYFDFSIDELGRVVLIEGDAKLTQDVVKGTLTIKGSNPYHPWYGTILDTLIGTKIADFEKLKLLISQDVQELFSNIKDLQIQQSEVQDISDNERIEQLISIQSARPDSANPSFVTVSITYRNRAGNIREIRRVLDRNTARVFGTIQDRLKGYK